MRRAERVAGASVILASPRRCPRVRPDPSASCIGGPKSGLEREFPLGVRSAGSARVRRRFRPAGPAPSAGVTREPGGRPAGAVPVVGEGRRQARRRPGRAGARPTTQPPKPAPVRRAPSAPWATKRSTSRSSSGSETRKSSRRLAWPASRSAPTRSRSPAAQRGGALEHPGVLGDHVAGDRVVGAPGRAWRPAAPARRSGPRRPRTPPAGRRTRCRRARARCRSARRGSRGRRGAAPARRSRRRQSSSSAWPARPYSDAIWSSSPPGTPVAATSAAEREPGERLGGRRARARRPGAARARARPTARSTTTGRRPAGTVECTARSAPADVVAARRGPRWTAPATNRPHRGGSGAGSRPSSGTSTRPGELGGAGPDHRARCAACADPAFPVDRDAAGTSRRSSRCARR